IKRTVSVFHSEAGSARNHPLYTLFVKAIVAYCFPSVKESYCDNISRTYLDDNYNMWEDEDKQLYKELKDALTF
ncbi:MAG: hypothetical protein ACI4T5_08840, partial [Prevotella sp.]